MVFWAFICYCVSSKEAIAYQEKKIMACFVLAGMFKETEKNYFSVQTHI